MSFLCSVPHLTTYIASWLYSNWVHCVYAWHNSYPFSLTFEVYFGVYNWIQPSNCQGDYRVKLIMVEHQLYWTHLFHGWSPFMVLFCTAWDYAVKHFHYLAGQSTCFCICRANKFISICKWLFTVVNLQEKKWCIATSVCTRLLLSLLIE